MDPKYHKENNIRKKKTTVQITRKLWGSTGLVILGIIFVGVMVYVGFTEHIKFKNYIVNQNQNLMLKSAESIAKSLEYYIKEHTEHLQIGSSYSNFRDNIFSGLNKIKGTTEIDPVKTLYEINIGDVDAVYAIDHKGTVLQRHPLREGAIGDDYSEKPGFKYVSEFQKPYISEVLKTTSGRYAVSITVPVLDNGRFIGALRWLVESERIFRNVLANHNQEHEAAWLIDADGEMISHPVAYHIGSNYLKVHKRKYPNVDWSELEAIMGSITTGKSGVGLFNYHSTYEKSSLGVRQLIAYAPIRVHNQLWAVGVTKDYAYIATPIDENARNTALQIVVLSLVYGGLGYCFHRTQQKKAILEAEADNLREIAKTSEALSKSENKFRSLTENIPVGIYRSTTDSKGKFIEANPWMIKMCGYDNREEFLSLNVKDLYQDPPERTQFIEKILITGSVEGEELNLKKKDGNKIICNVTAEAIKDEKGNVLYIDGIVQEITERKRMEEELLKSEKIESVGLLAGGIAHDFNNLLQAIFAGVTLAKTSFEAGGKAFQLLEETEETLIKARHLSQQLLTFSKGGAPVKKTLSLSPLIQDSVKFALSGSNVKSNLSIAEDLWPVEVDEGQINQVIQNIIINADQAMPDGGTVKIRAENLATTVGDGVSLKEGKYVVIYVEDSGIGIPLEHVSRIFDPYFTTKKKGSGLGLATAYSIIKKHDGLIRVESKVGTGTTFTIYFPASEKALKEIKDVYIDSLPGEGRILVMDDERFIRLTTKRFLQKRGYEVEVAEDGSQAIEMYIQTKASGKPFDVVVLDLTVPGGMGGDKAIKKLLEIDPEVKVILSSGYADDPIMAKYGNYGFKAALSKPYKMEELSKAIHVLKQENIKSAQV